jgi:hypothetical protein
VRAPIDIGTQSLPGTAYAQRPDVLPDAELSTLAAVYRYVLDCHAKNEVAPENRPDAGKEIGVLASIFRLALDSANKNAASVISTNGDDAKERSKDDSSATRNYTELPTGQYLWILRLLTPPDIGGAPTDGP